MPPPDLRPLLTSKEAADYLRLSVQAIHCQRYRGEKPGVLGVRIGKRLLFRADDLERFIEERLAEQAASR